MKKPKCPMCGANIVYKQYSVDGCSSNPSSLIGGIETTNFYRCEANFDICRVSSSVYNAFVLHNNIHDGYLNKSKNWRDGLRRYNGYIDFLIDHPILVGKILALANDELEIKCDWSYLAKFD